MGCGASESQDEAKANDVQTSVAAEPKLAAVAKKETPPSPPTPAPTPPPPAPAEEKALPPPPFDTYLLVNGSKRVDCYSTGTLAGFKQRVFEAFGPGWAPGNMECVVNHTNLNSNATLWTYGIRDGDELVLLRHTAVLKTPHMEPPDPTVDPTPADAATTQMKISVSYMTGNPFTFEVTAATTIDELRRMVVASMGVAIDDRLMYQRSLLDDSLSLASLCLLKGAHVQVNVKAP